LILQEKKESELYIDRSNSLVSVLTEKGKEDLLKALILELKREGLTEQKLFELYNFANESMLVPLSVFSTNLSPLESLSKFLKEEMSLNYHSIGELVKRNERSIWATYKNASSKMPGKFQLDWSIKIPLSIFSNRKLSILENLVYFLVEKYKLSCREVSEMLHKSSSTVWTTYNRAKKKIEK